MRTLTFIAILIALAFVAFQQLAGMKRSVDAGDGAQPIATLPDTVRSDVDAATRERTEALERALQQQ